MTPAAATLTRDVVLMGGGHAHALVLRRWGMKPVAGVRLTLINPGPTAPYTGMLPGFVAGHYGRDALDIDLVRLARHAGARLILDRATGIDREARTISLGNRPPIGYDIASIDIGIASDLPDLPGFSEFGVAAKPLGPFATRWEAFRSQDGPASIVVLGAGVGGVELSLAIAHALRARGRMAAITIIDRGKALSGTAGPAARRLRRQLAQAGITLLEDTEAIAVTASSVQLSTGVEIPSDLTVGAAGARPQNWLTGTGLELRDGFIAVDETLRAVNDPRIYASGDCAHLIHAPRPKAGVFAVRAAPVLAANIRADLLGEARRSFRPQRDYLKLISLGGKLAVAEKFGMSLEGDWVWRWKDRIDRRFMDRLTDLPRMSPPEPMGDVARDRAAAPEAPLCGGCGAKVGGATLAAALERLPASPREDVITAPGDDAAILDIGGTRQVITTDHLRAFTEDPYALARIAALHALGDIWAMSATPQAALAQVILPRQREKLAARALDEILAAAGAVFAAEGAALAGGHTTMGAEMTIGFTVTGLAQRPVTLAGARPGDALVLTRPIGSGVLLAAEMQGEARGADVAGCLAEMGRSQGHAARLLAGARAMTDVTGFGLAGHLLNICAASGTGAHLTLGSVPVYPGAEALTTEGHRSTLFEPNRAAASGRLIAPDEPRADLLFDPQTAGGLLAAIPAEDRAALLSAFEVAGLPLWQIGEITEGAPVITAD